MGDDGAAAPHIRVVWGTGTGPTAVASYDAALAAANVHDYNLVTLSSIVPPGAAVEPVGTAPDLGPVGGRLWTVQARATAQGPASVSAALGWAVGETGGVFYEDARTAEAASVRETVTDGLAAARELRDADLPEEGLHSVTVGVEDGSYGSAVVLAAFGRAESIGGG